MSDKTAISWTDATWNPVTGCSHVSEGCRNCYAEALSLRFGRSKLPWTAPNAAANVQLHPERLQQPLRWQDPRRVFVNSMSDLFHEQIPGPFIAEVFRVMGQASQHTFQVLTKRPQRMRQFIEGLLTGYEPRLWPLSNVWLGVSVEDQRAADERIPLLLQTPAAVRFLSCEPLLGPVDLQPWLPIYSHEGPPCCMERRGWHRTQRSCGLDWVIIGGESGPRFRPMDLRWARALHEQCEAAGVAVWFKQDSGRLPGRGTAALGREYHEFPQVLANITEEMTS